MEWITEDFSYNASYIDVPIDPTLYHLPYTLLKTKLLLVCFNYNMIFFLSIKKHLFFLYRIRGRSWMMSQPNTLNTCSLLCYLHKKAHYYVKI